MPAPKKAGATQGALIWQAQRQLEALVREHVAARQAKADAIKTHNAEVQSVEARMAAELAHLTELRSGQGQLFAALEPLAGTDDCDPETGEVAE